MDKSKIKTDAIQVFDAIRSEKRKNLLSLIDARTMDIKYLTSSISQYKNLIDKKEITETDERRLYNGATSEELKQLWDMADQLELIEKHNKIYMWSVVFLSIISLSISSIFLGSKGVKTIGPDVIISFTSFALACLMMMFFSKSNTKRRNIYNQLALMMNTKYLGLDIDLDKYQRDFKYKRTDVPNSIKKYIAFHHHAYELTRKKNHTVYKFIFPIHQHVATDKYKNLLDTRDDYLVKLQSLLDELAILDAEFTNKE